MPSRRLALYNYCILPSLPPYRVDIIDKKTETQKGKVNLHISLTSQ